MRWLGVLGFLFCLMAGAPALAKPAPDAGSACPASGEAACLLDAAWAAALALPEQKLERVKPLFAPLAARLADPKAKAVWARRLGETGPRTAGADYARQTAETAIGELGWEAFLQRARDGLAPLHMGRPEIMGAAIELAPDAKQRARLVELMFTLAGAPKTLASGKARDNDFERADFGHVLADRMMRDCRLAEFDRAAAMTSDPDALRYKLWRARITGGAGALAGKIRAGDGSEDTSHVRQAIEGYGAVLELGYCPK
jgi:hypothetical protein